MKKIGLAVVGVVIIAVIILFAFGTGDSKKNGGAKPVVVERGEIVEKAMAIGTIQPYKEILVKSKISGIVKKLYVEVGDRVKSGDLLMEISPQPTPLEYTEAKRNVDIAQINFDNAALAYDRAEELFDKKLISKQEYDDKKVAFDQAKMQLNLQKERLQLLEKGSIRGGECECREHNSLTDHRLRAVTQCQRGRSSGTAYLVSGGDRCHYTGGYERSDLPRHCGRDRCRQTARRYAGNAQGRRSAKGYGARRAAQDFS